jgi:hypothetical protein
MTSMKLTKILILTLALMTIAATVSFANENFISSAGRRIIAVNSETGETSSILLSATGPDGGIIPAGESIFLTYDAEISSLGDIAIRVQTDEAVAGDFTAYGDFVDLTGAGLGVQARIGLTATDYRTIQIRFTQDVSFVTADTIAISGVRVNAAKAFSQAIGSVVKVNFTNAVGEAVVTNGLNLEVAETREPLEVSNPASPSIQLRADGTAINDVATVTIGELFTNAFETKADPEQTMILITVTDVPEGITFNGISGLAGTASAAYGGTCTYAGLADNQRVICIDTQDESLLEDIEVGLKFVLEGPTVFAPTPATVTVTLFPPGSGAYPWPFPLKYAQRNLASQVNFLVSGVVGGKLLATFNTVISNPETEEQVLNTGVAIINGSGTAGLPVTIGQAGAITVNMYPLDGSGPFSFTTSADMRPGLGLDEDGRLPPKGTWAVLVSQFLPYAENEDGDLIMGDFEGYIIFTMEFPNADGVNYIADSNFEVQAQGYQMINLARRDAEDTARSKIDELYLGTAPPPAP